MPQPEAAVLAPIRKPPREALAQLEKVVVEGNLASLTENERIGYYARVCESLGLNPLTRPFEYITLNGKLTLYARKDATDQLRRINGISIEKLDRERDEDLDLAIVTAYAIDRYGATDSAIGAVSIKGLAGEAMANALMKAETKAKRRVTLSLAGLGWLDEIEAEDRRAVEVRPRSEIKSAIASRTAALTQAADVVEADVDQQPLPSGEQEDTGEASSTSATTRSAACSHPVGQRENRPEGIVCTACGTILAARNEQPDPPRAEVAGGRARPPATRRRSSSAQSDEGKAEPAPARRRRANSGPGAAAHAAAAERGLDHEALRPIAAALFDVAPADLEAFSMSELVPDEWEALAQYIRDLPNPLDEDSATVWVGQIGREHELMDWKAIDPLVTVATQKDPASLTPAEWVVFGTALRQGAFDKQPATAGAR